MNIAIVGGRNFEDYAKLKNHINNCGIIITKVVSGGARGCDSLARKYAKEYNIQLLEFIPEWEKYGKSAGFKRNELIISNADWVFAFWDGSSKGTKSSIDISRRLGKPLEIIFYKS